MSNKTILLCMEEPEKALDLELQIRSMRLSIQYLIFTIPTCTGSTFGHSECICQQVLQKAYLRLPLVGDGNRRRRPRKSDTVSFSRDLEMGD